MNAKTFNFFQEVQSTDLFFLNVRTNSTDKIQVTSFANSAKCVFLGDKFGQIHMLRSDLTVQHTTQAFEGSIMNLIVVRDKPLLISVGEDALLSQKFKVWNYESNELVLVFNSSLSQKIGVTSLDCTYNLSYIAFAQENGRITLLSNDTNRSQITLKNYSKIEDLMQVKNLCFAKFDGNFYLYVIFNGSSINVYQLMKTSLSEKRSICEGLKEDISCCCTTQDGLLVVATEKAFYYFNPKGQIESFKCNSKKISMQSLGTYCVCVEEKFKQSYLVVCEPFCGFTACSQKFDKIAFIFCGSESMIFVITQNSKIYQVAEISMQEKIQSFIKAGEYEIGISHMERCKCDKAQISNFRMRYGNHLYEEKNYKGAVMQYIETIDYLEPSYVIKKFLNIEQISNLILYLEGFYKSGKSSPSQNTLLLSCYIKMNYYDKIDFIINRAELEFEFEQTIDELCRAGCSHHALALAKSKNNHDWCIRIFLEDEKYQEALKYIESLSPELAIECLLKYGRILSIEMPQALVSNILACWPLYKQNYFSSPGNKIRGIQAIADGFVNVLIDQREHLIEFLQMVIYQGHVSPYLCHTLLEMYLCSYEKCIADGEVDLAAQINDATLKILNFPQMSLDNGHALSLCQLHNFEPGIDFYFEKFKELRPIIIQKYMSVGKHDLIIPKCKRLIGSDSHVWFQILNYFLCLIEQHGDKYVLQVLEYIQSKNLSNPVQVFSMLAKSETLTLATVKNYIYQVFDYKCKIDEFNEFIDEKNKENKIYEQRAENFNTADCVFDQRWCSAQFCDRMLDTPAVYFQCSHAFHLRCLDKQECPICTSEFEDLIELCAAFQSKALEHEEFFKILKKSQNKFSVGCEYFARGIFELPNLNNSDVSSSTSSKSVNVTDSISDDLNAVVAKFLESTTF